MSDEIEDELAPECPTCIQYQEIQDIKVKRIKELQEKLGVAVKALKQCHEIIHDEFCGKSHHIFCRELKEALKEIGEDK